MKTTADRIKEFLQGWGYSLSDLVGYLEKYAQGVTRKESSGMNRFLNELLVRETVEPSGKEIPKCDDANDHFAKDIRLMLGIGPEPVTLEDLSAYAAEAQEKIRSDRQKAETASAMQVSGILRGLGSGEDARRVQESAELIERHRRLSSATCDMSAFLRNMEPGSSCDMSVDTHV